MSDSRKASLKLALSLVIGLGCLPVSAANFVVTIATDTVDPNDGEISLREAVEAANSNAAASGAAAGEATAGDADGDTISFDASLTTVNVASLSLIVTEDLVIDGGGTITIDGGQTTRLFTIIAGAGEPVSINNATLQNALGDANGGAISVAAGSTLSMTNATLTNNVAIADNANEGGGAINNQGALTLNNVVVSGNAVNASAPSIPANGNGGGLLNGPSASLTMTNGMVMGNTAGRAGGGIENAGGTVDLTGVTLSANSILNNDPTTPTLSGEAGGNGGALHSGGGTVTLTNCTVSGNTAGREGGGLWNGGSGAVMNVTGGSLANNEARGAEAHDGGGALFNNGGSLTVDAVEVAGNRATGSLGSGGGLLNLTGNVVIKADAATGFSRWSGNTAVRAGGAIEDNSNGDGGSVAAAQSMLTIDGIDLYQNIVDSAGNTAIGNGGALHITGNSQVQITNSSVAENTATKEGGGLWVFSTSSLTVANTTVSGNDAPDGGGIFTQPSGTLVLINSTVASNTATVKGGGLSNGAGALVDADNTIIADNTLADTAEATAGPDVDGAISADFSIIENRIGADVTGANNQLGDPLLGTLSLHIPTQTRVHEITRGSAVDTGNDSVCASSPVNNLDQRQQTRPADGNNDGTVIVCDIGAFERGGNALIAAAQDAEASDLVRIETDSTDVEVLSFTLINSGTETINAQGFSGVLTGNGNFDKVVSNVQVFLDDGDKVPSAGDTLIPSTVTIDNTNRNFNVVFNSDQSVATDPGTTFIMTATITVVGTAPAATARFLLPVGIAAMLVLGWRQRELRLVLAASLGLSLLTACGSNSGEPAAVQGADSVSFETFRFTATGVSATNSAGETVITSSLPRNGGLISVPR